MGVGLFVCFRCLYGPCFLFGCPIFYGRHVSLYRYLVLLPTELVEVMAHRMLAATGGRAALRLQQQAASVIPGAHGIGLTPCVPISSRSIRCAHACVVHTCVAPISSVRLHACMQPYVLAVQDAARTHHRARTLQTCMRAGLLGGCGSQVSLTHAPEHTTRGAPAPWLARRSSTAVQGLQTAIVGLPNVGKVRPPALLVQMPRPGGARLAE